MKVIMAMSGGVDSSVSAALLKESGFEVIGIFLKLHSKSSSKRARKVAKEIGIPFYVLDKRKEFEEEIINYFLEEYKKGNTPNPCVMCNRKIKFKLLFEELKKHKADYVATGHYAKIIKSGLFKSGNKNKDQSYFLYRLNKDILSKILFPVGGYDKPNVRKIAKELGLSVWDAGESQEVCFIPKTTSDFLKGHLKEKDGDIIDKEGNKLGQHKGTWFYTIGQRKGIGLAGGPYYVVSKDVKKNIIVVSKNERDLYRKEFQVKDINWIKKPLKFPIELSVRIRYKGRQSSGFVYNNKVVFKRPQKAITSGQSAVFYNNKEVLGGGIII